LELDDESWVNDYLDFIKVLYNDLYIIVANYGRMWSKGEIISKLNETKSHKPIIFVEGQLDVDYINKAAELLGRSEICQQAEFRAGGGAPNMDNLWRLFKDLNWDEAPMKKVLLYDCDTNKIDEQYGDVYKRIIPKINENPIEKGIENLFNKETIEKIITHQSSLVDRTTTIRVQRGIEQKIIKYMINEHEKRNLCNWLLEYGCVNDFESFEVILDMIQYILDD
jgi:hypothetical protein